MEELDDMQFDIRIRTRKSFKEIVQIKHAQKETVEQLFKKMGIKFNG